MKPANALRARVAAAGVAADEAEGVVVTAAEAEVVDMAVEEGEVATVAAVGVVVAAVAVADVRRATKVHRNKYRRKHKSTPWKSRALLFARARGG